ncbi:CARDB domain-containing protein [Gemmatimonadota bacterium]
MRADFPPARASARRPGRSSLVVLITGLLAWIGCVDVSTTPGGSYPALLPVAAVFPEGVSSQARLIDEWRVQVTRPGVGVIAEEGGPVSPGQETVQAQISVDLEAECENLQVRIELLSEGDVWFQGEDEFQVCAGGGGAARAIQLGWAAGGISPETKVFNVRQGESQTQTFTITYAGGRPLSWSVRAQEGSVGWLSTDPSSGSVSAAQPQTVAVTVDASDLQPGRYFANLLVEPEGIQSPMKRVLVDLTVLEAPSRDLVVSSLLHSPENPTTEDVVTVSAIVRNDGNASAAASLLRLELTGAGTTTHDVPTLGPGQSYEVQRSAGMLSAGSYTVTATADDGDTVEESSETNNQRSDAFTVTGVSRPDLVVSSLTHAPGNPTSNDGITLLAVVRNDGDAPAEASVLRLEMTGVSTTTHDVPVLGSGQSYEVQRSLGTLSEGSYTVTATADGGGAVEESNETNNQSTESFVVADAPRPDLVVSSLTHSPSAVTTNDAVTLKAVVKNDGNAAAAASVLRLELAGASTTTHTVPALGPGQTYEVQRPLGTLSAGGHTATATADDGDAVEESNETNNQRTHTFTVGALPDLVVSSLTHSPANPTADDGVTLAAVVRNNGNVVAGASVLSLEFPGAGTTTHSVPVLAPGQGYQVQRSVGTVPEGDHSVTATADATTIVEESDETNNQRTDAFSVTVAPRPDLVVSSLTHSPENPTSSDEIIITAVVRNDGNGPAGTSVLRLGLTGTTHDLPALAPGEEYQVQRSAGTRPAGAYVVTATADFANTVEESDETNNERTDAFSVAQAPELWVSPTSMSFTTVQGSNPPPQVLTVKNIGGGTLTWSYGFARGLGTCPWVPDLTPPSGSLVAGDSILVTVTLQTPCSAGQTGDGFIQISSNGGTAAVNVAVTVNPLAFTISSVLPGTASPGQMVAVLGGTFPGFPNSPEAVFHQGAAHETGFVFSAPSGPDRLYVRLPEGGSLSDGPATLTLIAADQSGQSNAYPITISTTPGTPLVQGIYSVADPQSNSGCGGNISTNPVTTVNRGDGLAIAAYGLDTSGTTAVFTQGAFTQNVASTCAVSGSFGLVSIVPIPDGLQDGQFTVQVFTTEGGVQSDLSASATLTLVSPPAPSLDYSFIEACPAVILTSAWAETSTVTVAVRDQNADPMVGAAVTLTDGGSFGPISLQTGPDGHASASYSSASAGQKTFTAQISAMGSDLTLQESDDLLVDNPRGAYLVKVAGDGQTIIAGQSGTFTVDAKTSTIGVIVSNIPVGWAVEGGNCFYMYTDGAGRASMVVSVGASSPPGTYTVSADLAGSSPVTFTFSVASSSPTSRPSSSKDSGLWGYPGTERGGDLDRHERPEAER